VIVRLAIKKNRQMADSRWKSGGWFLVIITTKQVKKLGIKEKTQTENAKGGYGGWKKDSN
jgi:hypothetical protein